MGQKSGPVKEPAEQVVKQIRRATRRQFSAEEKIRIVLTGLRGEDSIAELCRREGIVQNEGLGVDVVLIEVAFDGGLEVDDRFEDAALEASPSEGGEEGLDGIEP